MDGRLALVGSGEFLPVMEEVDGLLLRGRAPRAVIVPTAAAPEGEGTVRYWLDLGVAHYRRLGVEPVECPVLDREHADDEAFAERIAGAGLVYLSGGNPGYLAATLAGTLVWEAILAAVAAGAALAGCSAGAMAMTALAPDVARPDPAFGPGLGLLDHLTVIPHFDQMEGWRPGIVDAYLRELPEDSVLVGIDEETALVGGPDEWAVMGRATVTVFGRDGSRHVHTAGETITPQP